MCCWLCDVCAYLFKGCLCWLLGDCAVQILHPTFHNAGRNNIKKARGERSTDFESRQSSARGTQKVPFYMKYHGVIYEMVALRHWDWHWIHSILYIYNNFVYYVCVFLGSCFLDLGFWALGDWQFSETVANHELSKLSLWDAVLHHVWPWLSGEI